MSTQSLTPLVVEQAFLKACHGELKALKPGNVHIHAGGHKLRVAEFEASANAAAPVIARVGLSVGKRILRAVEATREAVHTNTNLGIILLCAPIIQAVLKGSSESMEEVLEQVLRDLTVQDAVDTYEAINLAKPGGMGEAKDHDLSDVPEVTLLEAMKIASEHDRIALQYARCYEDVISFGLRKYCDGLSLYDQKDWATTHLFFGFLASFPDSLIARKYGLDVAEDVRARAEKLCSEIGQSLGSDKALARLLDFDRVLKEQGLNPGTSADLTVATLFWFDLCEMLRAKGR